MTPRGGASRKQKESEWFSTPEDRRRRKSIELTLSEATLDRLEKMSRARKVSRSVVIDELVTEAPIRRPKVT